MYHNRRMRRWIDERGEQYDEDAFVYNFVPGATSDNGVSGTLAPGATAIAQVQIEQDSAFEWNLTTITASDNATDAALNPPNISVQIIDSSTGRKLSNDPVPVSLIAGTGKFPYVLPFPRRFMPKSTVTVSFTNFDTAKTYKLIQLNMVGRKLFMRTGGRPLARFKTFTDPQASQVYGRQILLAEDYFVYHFTFGAINAAANAQNTQIIESDSDFEMRSLSFAAWDALNTGSPNDTGNFVSFKMKDGGSQRELQFSPTMAFAGAGQEGVPLIEPQPRIWLAQTSAIWTAFNNSAGTNLAAFDMCMAGRKIFEVGE